MRNELQTVLTAARELPAGELPRLLGELEEIRCTAMARLTAPAPAQSQVDELLSATEAARRLESPKITYIAITAIFRLRAALEDGCYFRLWESANILDSKSVLTAIQHTSRFYLSGFRQEVEKHDDTTS